MYTFKQASTDYDFYPLPTWVEADVKKYLPIAITNAIVKASATATVVAATGVKTTVTSTGSTITTSTSGTTTTTTVSSSAPLATGETLSQRIARMLAEAQATKAP
jgi:hypothetical protein